ncbi:hypothetical protein TUSST3_29440 [Streptomyces sp. TUS-ST3]|nr:hypothetical protein TUSST3_29440 [Streptomyces sp. TUS-ST3]
MSAGLAAVPVRLPGPQTLTSDARVRGKAVGGRPGSRPRARHGNIAPAKYVSRWVRRTVTAPTARLRSHTSQHPKAVGVLRDPHAVDTFRPTCLHPAMPFSEPLTRRRAVDLVRVAAALCRTAG